MNFRRLYFILIVFLYNPLVELLSQVDTFEIIPLIIKEGSSPIYNPLGSSEYDLTSNAPSMILDGITQQLEGLPGVFIRNSGPGSAATLSVLGSSTNQTAIFWNGIPLNSPTLGIADLSLLPASLFSKQALLYGSNSTVFGSGAIGGVLNLNTPLLWNTNRVSVDIGSFGKFGGSLHQNLTKGRLTSSITLQAQKGEFDYSYSIDGDNKKRQLQHNAFDQVALQPNLEFEISPVFRIKYAHWYQRSHKEIPPTTTQTRSVAMQDDVFNRGILTLESTKKNKNLGIQLAYFDEHNGYQDSIQGIDAENKSKIITLKPYFSKTSAHSVFYIDGMFQRFIARTDGYSEGASENRLTFFSSYTIDHKKFRTVIGLRANIFDGRFTPLIPNIAYSYFLSERISLRTKLNYNYRLPTLNERFWMPGGNPDLESEEGWSAELGIKFKKPTHWLHEFELFGFSRWIDNWLLWAPINGGPIWGAQNLDKVWSRGVVMQNTMNFKILQSNLSMTSSYSLTLSEYRADHFSGLYDYGQQLLYIPKHQASLRFRYFFKSLDFNTQFYFSDHFQGAIFTLDSYTIQNMNIKWTKQLNKKAFHITLGLDNIWNQQYQLIERRPMPGRSVHLNFKYEY